MSRLYDGHYRFRLITYNFQTDKKISFDYKSWKIKWAVVRSSFNTVHTISINIDALHEVLFPVEYVFSLFWRIDKR